MNKKGRRQLLKTFCTVSPFCGSLLVPFCGSSSALLQKFRDEAGPAGLVARTDARTVVAMEVFVEGNQVAPVRIILEFRGRAKDRPSFVGVSQEDARQPFRDLTGDLPQREHLAGTNRTLDFEVVAEVVMKLLQR